MPNLIICWLVFLTICVLSSKDNKGEIAELESKIEELESRIDELEPESCFDDIDY